MNVFENLQAKLNFLKSAFLLKDKKSFFLSGFKTAHDNNLCLCFTNLQDGEALLLIF